MSDPKKPKKKPAARPEPAVAVADPSERVEIGPAEEVVSLGPAEALLELGPAQDIVEVGPAQFEPRYEIGMAQIHPDWNVQVGEASMLPEYEVQMGPFQRMPPVPALEQPAEEMELGADVGAELPMGQTVPYQAIPQARYSGHFGARR
jgi:hypothetical protein